MIEGLRCAIACLETLRTCDEMAREAIKNHDFQSIAA